MENKPRVLIVEDNSVYADYLAVCIPKIQDCDIDIAKTIKQAQVNYYINKYDLAIVDLYLPDGKGMDFIHDIRFNGDNNLEFVVLTGYSSIDTIVEALSMGVYSYAEKTSPTNELRRVITSALVKSGIKKKINTVRTESALKNENVR